MLALWLGHPDREPRSVQDVSRWFPVELGLASFGLVRKAQQRWFPVELGLTPFGLVRKAQQKLLQVVLGLLWVDPAVAAQKELGEKLNSGLLLALWEVLLQMALLLAWARELEVAKLRSGKRWALWELLAAMRLVALRVLRRQATLVLQNPQAPLGPEAQRWLRVPLGLGAQRWLEPVMRERVASV